MLQLPILRRAIAGASREFIPYTLDLSAPPTAQAATPTHDSTPTPLMDERCHCDFIPSQRQLMIRPLSAAHGCRPRGGPLTCAAASRVLLSIRPWPLLLERPMRARRFANKSRARRTAEKSTTIHITPAANAASFCRIVALSHVQIAAQ